MQIIYAQQPIPNQINKSIFLAGPSLRPGQEGISWRIKALEILEILEYDGIVFVPEFKEGIFDDNFNWETQVLWESRCLKMADNIIFHINRNIDKKLLGLTTNTEFGQWMDSGKCILITPPDANKVEYQEWWAKQLKVPSFHDLFNGLKYIINTQIDCYRIDGERFISQEIWQLEQFQSWYKQLKLNGNWICDAKILNCYRIPSNNKVFAFSLWANIYIKSENRYKNNEFIFSRPDISSCVLYYPNENKMQTEVVLVSEFRTPVNNEKGLVYELPGGSSHKAGVDPKVTIIEELEEETGFKPMIDNLKFENEKQLCATLLTHKSYLFSYELNKYELEQIKSNQNKIFGIEADSERTMISVFTLEQILDAKYIDWTTIGQIMSVIK